MSGMNSDQLHRSTLGIYSGLMDEFNPSLQKLASLGNSYVRAYQVLAAASEAYFSTLSKIGEQAFRTASSRSIGDVLMQICQSQRRLTTEMEGVFSWFSVEVLQEMENNVSLDMDYISDSRKHYEMEVHNQAAALERQMRRGTNQDCSQYVQFLRESHDEALKEEERRYRFLAEKHCSLTQSITRLMNTTGGPLQQRAEAWTVDVDATRRPEARRPASLDSSAGMKEEDMWRFGEEQLLGKIPSRAPSPVGSSRSGSVVSGGGAGGGRSMRAKVDHQPSGSNPTLLPFTKGQMITALIQQPKNGWLYGRVDGSSRQGWFPVTYVEAVEDFPTSTSSGSSTLRSSSSTSSLLSQSGSGSQSGAPPPPPPPPPSLSSNKHSEMPSITPTHDRKAESNSEHKQRSKPQGSQPELFPRGTNPFATVKLKPTSTNDRSGPRLYR